MLRPNTPYHTDRFVSNTEAERAIRSIVHTKLLSAIGELNKLTQMSLGIITIPTFEGVNKYREAIAEYGRQLKQIEDMVDVLNEFDEQELRDLKRAEKRAELAAAEEAETDGD